MYLVVAAVFGSGDAGVADRTLFSQLSLSTISSLYMYSAIFRSVLVFFFSSLLIVMMVWLVLPPFSVQYSAKLFYDDPSSCSHFCRTLQITANTLQQLTESFIASYSEECLPWVQPAEPLLEGIPHYSLQY